MHRNVLKGSSCARSSITVLFSTDRRGCSFCGVNAPHWCGFSHLVPAFRTGAWGGGAFWHYIGWALCCRWKQMIGASFWSRDLTAASLISCSSTPHVHSLNTCSLHLRFDFKFSKLALDIVKQSATIKEKPSVLTCTLHCLSTTAQKVYKTCLGWGHTGK